MLNYLGKAKHDEPLVTFIDHRFDSDRGNVVITHHAADETPVGDMYELHDGRLASVVYHPGKGSIPETWIVSAPANTNTSLTGGPGFGPFR